MNLSLLLRPADAAPAVPYGALGGEEDSVCIYEVISSGLIRGHWEHKAPLSQINMDVCGLCVHACVCVLY